MKRKNVDRSNINIIAKLYSSATVLNAKIYCEDLLSLLGHLLSLSQYKLQYSNKKNCTSYDILNKLE